MKDRIYIHYGDDKFYPERVKIKNSVRNKPHGGLWASPIDSKLSWKRWCESEGFDLDRLEKHFKFKLKDGAKVFFIDNVDAEKKLPRRYYCDSFVGVSMPGIASYDFEKLVEMGYDAVEVNFSSDYRNLYYQMYGWDCDSIVILNPDVVEVIFE